ncbi:Glycine--tRNA ligase [Gimesia panareensis]|uniref:Glycine--tRNA ligase n=1 Tax=Gimesia panareensis TaxID=2527978 RepID=A0A518FKL7_9PLAN|nr:glycine--tRNA ligase [Gimesia panareensis]QDV16857.1 Glycine--tRNA ligase [Gimesia panareensis]
MKKEMEKIVALCKRRGFVFQSSEIYGGLQGFWDYGPLGVELKRNVREAWWSDMITTHNELITPEGAPKPFGMTGVETTIIMHPSVWKSSGHFDLFHDFMVDSKESKARFRVDHVSVAVAYASDEKPVACETYMADIGEEGLSKTKRKRLEKAIAEYEKENNLSNSEEPQISVCNLMEYAKMLADAGIPATGKLEARCPETGGELTEPREFNLMFKTIIGALSGEEGTAFLRPETAQGMFVNFKNVVDSGRVKIPFGIAQIGKSFRNEITPRNYTFRSREFEQMEMEFFCHPDESFEWYKYWRDRRYNWYIKHGINPENLILRDHTQEELAHYSVGTADVEYAFPFMEENEYGELEGIAHRGDFDLRSHMEGKLVREGDQLVVEKNEHGQPKYKGSGKDLTYFDDQTRERFIPHVIEPAAGADRATLAFLCEAYYEDEQPDENDKMQSRTVMKFHPKLAPVKAAVFPLIKKAGMPEVAADIYGKLKKAGIQSVYDQQGAIGRRYRRQDEIGTPFCLTVDGETEQDNCVTLRDRDSLKQERVPIDDIVAEVQRRIHG